jgi:hypothetical protein
LITAMPASFFVLVAKHSKDGRRSPVIGGKLKLRHYRLLTALCTEPYRGFSQHCPQRIAGFASLPNGGPGGHQLCARTL